MRAEFARRVKPCVKRSTAPSSARRSPGGQARSQTSSSAATSGIRRRIRLPEWPPCQVSRARSCWSAAPLSSRCRERCGRRRRLPRSRRRCAAPCCSRARPPTRARRPSTTRATTPCTPPPSRCRWTRGDLAAGLKVARARHIPFRMRSGGHSYIGASTVAGGVVFDLRRLRGIKLLSDGTVLAGAGLHADRADQSRSRGAAARSCTAPARPSASAGSRSAAATASMPACTAWPATTSSPPA